LIGYISLNEIFSKEYNSVNWNYIDNGKPLIIHRLAVKSSFQGQGIAKKIIQFAENHAKNNGYRTIRLDAFSKNRQALGLYEKLEYKYAGDVLFRKGVFVCFDKK
jgi:ribosomal protein S18 acetylase RimI-like enzyme